MLNGKGIVSAVTLEKIWERRSEANSDCNTSISKMRGPWLNASLDAGSRPSHGMVCSSGLTDWGPCVFLCTPFDLCRVIQEGRLIYVEVLVKFLCVQFWTGTEMELFESPDLMPLDFLLWVWVKSEVYKRKGGYSRRTARSHFGRCCLHKETRRSTETNNTRSLHSICEVYWGWQWDFWTFIVNCDRFVI
jgi:hypothetical protein